MRVHNNRCIIDAGLYKRIDSDHDASKIIDSDHDASKRIDSDHDASKRIDSVRRYGIVLYGTVSRL